MAQQCLVRDLMLTRGAQPVPLNFPLRLAAERLLMSDADLLAVVDDLGKLAGVLSESSVVRLLLTNPPAETTIQSIVSRHCESVYEESHLSSISHLFRSDCHSAIPVVNRNGFVTGIIIRRHVLNVLLGANHSQPLVTQAPIQAVGLGEATPATSAEVQEQVAGNEPSAPNNTEPSARSPRPASGEPPRPHFLRAEEARRRLTLFDDQANP